MLKITIPPILTLPFFYYRSDQNHEEDPYLGDTEQEDDLRELEYYSEDEFVTPQDNWLSKGPSKEELVLDQVKQVINDRFASLTKPTIIRRKDSQLHYRIAYNPQNQKTYVLFKKLVVENSEEKSRGVLFGLDVNNHSKVVLKGLRELISKEEIRINRILSTRKDLFVATNEIHKYESFQNSFKDESITILVLEYLKRNLYDLVNKLSLKDKISIACDIAEGLAFMHDNNIVHRNLKMEHIFINRSNSAKKYQAKIANFKDSAFKDQTPKRGKGSEYYTPPEWKVQDDNYPKANFSSDVWSFGVILLFMFSEVQTCQLWWDLWQEGKHLSEDFSQSRDEILEKMKEENITNVQLFQFISQLISQCLEINPADRLKAKDIVAQMNEIRNIGTK